MSDTLHPEEMVLVALADIIMQIQFETRYNQLKRLEGDFVSQSKVSTGRLRRPVLHELSYGSAQESSH